MIQLRSLILFAVVCLSLTMPSIGQEKTSGQRIAELAAPLDVENALSVVHVDLAKVDVPAITQWAIQASPLDDRENAENTAKKLQELTSKLKAVGASDVVTVLYPSRYGNPFVGGETAVIVAAKAGAAKAAADVIRPASPESYYQVLERGDTVIFALEKRLKSLTPDAKPSATIAAAFDAARSAPIRVVLHFPDNLRRVVRETFPKLPDELGGLSGTDIADGISWGTISFDVPPKWEINAEIKTTNGEISKSLVKLIEAGVKQLDKIPQEADPDKIWAGISPTIEADASKVRMSIGGKPGDRDAVQTVVAKYLTVQRQIEMTTDHVNKLKNIVLAMHHFENVKGRFPARAIYDEAGRPLLSWRVQILPYLDQEKLYAKFKLNEPWDSEHNKKLIDQMPAEFASPFVGVKENGKTPFVVPIADKTMFNGKEGVRIFDITDGTSNTIMIATADAPHSVVWTKPDDLEIDPKDPTSSLHFGGGDQRKVSYFSFGDGSVRGIPRSELVDKILLLLTMNGGEVVPD
jgi:hypothetical protein